MGQDAETFIARFDDLQETEDTVDDVVDRYRRVMGVKDSELLYRAAACNLSRVRRSFWHYPRDRPKATKDETTMLQRRIRLNFLQLAVRGAWAVLDNYGLGIDSVKNLLEKVAVERQDAVLFGRKSLVWLLQKETTIWHSIWPFTEQPTCFGNLYLHHHDGTLFRIDGATLCHCRLSRVGGHHRRSDDGRCERV